MNVLKKNPSPELLFRKPSPRDLKDLDLLFQDPFYAYIRPRIKDSDMVMVNENEFLSSVASHLCEFNYIALNTDQQFIGYIKGYYPVTGHNLWIQILAINKDFAGQGFGKIVIKEIIQFILSKGPIQQVYLTCHNDNYIGYGFWTSIGFTKSKNIKDTHSLLEANLRSITCIPNHLRH